MPFIRSKTAKQWMVIFEKYYVRFNKIVPKENAKKSLSSNIFIFMLKRAFNVIDIEGQSKVWHRLILFTTFPIV